MTDISGAMEAARRICDGTDVITLQKDALTVALALLSSHPQRDGEGNRGSEPQVPAPVLTSDAIDGIVHLVGRDVAELPDRTSPDDQPDMMQVTADELEDAVRAALHAFLAYAPSPVDPWQPIETAPRGELIDIWIKNSEGDGGARWCDCYYDRICGEWRTSRPSGHLISVPERVVTHWRPRPAPPGADTNQQSKTGGAQASDSLARISSSHPEDGGIREALRKLLLQLQSDDEAWAVVQEWPEFEEAWAALNPAPLPIGEEK